MSKSEKKVNRKETESKQKVNRKKRKTIQNEQKVKRNYFRTLLKILQKAEKEVKGFEPSAQELKNF